MSKFSYSNFSTKHNSMLFKARQEWLILYRELGLAKIWFWILACYTGQVLLAPLPIPRFKTSAARCERGNHETKVGSQGKSGNRWEVRCVKGRFQRPSNDLIQRVWNLIAWLILKYSPFTVVKFEGYRKRSVLSWIESDLDTAWTCLNFDLDTVKGEHHLPGHSMSCVYKQILYPTHHFVTWQVPSCFAVVQWALRWAACYQPALPLSGTCIQQMSDHTPLPWWQQLVCNVAGSP